MPVCTKITNQKTIAAMESTVNTPIVKKGNMRFTKAQKRRFAILRSDYLIYHSDDKIARIV